MTHRIAIDPGVNTGVAVATSGVLVSVATHTFIEALFAIEELRTRGWAFELVIEDPRGIYVPPGQRNPQRLKGVGSVERDAKLWIEYAEHHGIPYRAVKPGPYRSIDAQQFARITGWQGRTSEHARAAAMMVFERPCPSTPLPSPR